MIAGLVRPSRIVRKMNRGGPNSPPPRLRKRRIEPQGVAFTLYPTRRLPEDYIDRRWALAAARETTRETALRDASSIAWPITEQRPPR